MNKKYSFIIITIYWVVIVVVIGIIGGILASRNASGGEQKLFVYFSYSLIIALIGAILINLFALFYYSKKERVSRLISVCFIIGSLLFLYPFLKGEKNSQFDVIEKTRFKDSDKIDIKIEFYPSSDSSRIVRSESYWKNGKKDSIWTVYDRDGSILRKRRYNNNELVEDIK